jgi:molybdopterin biosynthesis enzyme
MSDTTIRRSSVAAMLAPLLARLAPVAPVSLPLAEATGCWLAAPALVPAPVPRQPLALRGGLAVPSLEVAGASPQAPAMLMQAPRPVRVGEPLPAGCDAVIAADALTDHGGWCEIAEAASPGQHARLTGQDAPAGTVLCAAGERLTPEAALACAAAGLAALPVRRPRVALRLPAGPVAAWLGERLASLGCALLPAGMSADLTLLPAGDVPRLALEPGETAWAQADAGGITIAVPMRADAAFAAYAALVLPVVAALSGVTVARETRPLAGKLGGGIGTTDVALLRETAGLWQVLAVGDLPLAALARAEAFALLPAELEGLAAGTPLAATPLLRPLSPADRIAP